MNVAAEEASRVRFLGRPEKRKQALPSAGRRRLLHVGLGIAGLVVILLAWWISTDFLASERSFARRFSPIPALPTLFDLARGPDLWRHILVSLKRVLIGLVLGVPAGLLVDASKLAEAATTPALQFLRMISPLSWMPVAVMVFARIEAFCRHRRTAFRRRGGHSWCPKAIGDYRDESARLLCSKRSRKALV